MSNTRIFIFGDSITWGKWDLERGGWAERLRFFVDEKINMPETEKIVSVGLSKVDESKTNPIPWRPDIYYTNA